MMVRENMDSCNESGYLSTSSSPPEVAAGTRYMSYSGSVPYYDQDGYEQYCINNTVPLYMDPHMQAEGTENIPPMQGHVDQTTGMDSGLASAEGWQSGMPAYSYGQHPHPYFGMPGYELIPNQPPIMLGPNGKPKRRRIPTPAQRRAANIRERRRMFNLNEAFDDLRNKVPTFAYEKRLSRIETLRLAITYIGFMSDLLEGKEPKDIKIDTDKNVNWQLSPVSSEEAPETPVSSGNTC